MSVSSDIIEAQSVSEHFTNLREISMHSDHACIGIKQDLPTKMARMGLDGIFVFMIVCMPQLWEFVTGGITEQI